MRASGFGIGLAAVVALGLTACASAQEAPMAPGGGLQRLLHRVVAGNGGAGGGVFRVGGPSGALFEGTAGAAWQGGPAMESGASVEIASTSKAMTAAAVLVEVDRGHLDLDLPISTWLPSAVTHDLLVIGGQDLSGDLTLRQLLSHTSGLPDYWYDPPYVVPGFNAFLFSYQRHPEHQWTPEEVLDKARGLTPIGPPGAQWHYSDTGFVLAALVLERLRQQPLHEIYRDLLWRPLGMHDTWIHWREPEPAMAQFAHRYEGPTWDMTVHRHNSADWGGGGLVSTTADMDRFLRGLAQGVLFQHPSTMTAMTTWVPTGEAGVEYGLGLYHVDLGGPRGWIWGHDGYGNAWMYYWPKHDISFCGALNQTENDWWPLVEAAAIAIDR